MSEICFDYGMQTVMNCSKPYLRSAFVHYVNKFISSYPCQSQGICGTKIRDAVVGLFCKYIIKK